MKHVVLSAAVLCAVAVGADASAHAPAAAPAPVASAMAGLPEGHLPARPHDKPPKAIPRAERIEDFRAPKANEAPEEDACFTDSADAPAEESDSGVEGVTVPVAWDWPSQGMTREALDARLQTKPSPGEAVRAFHAERLVREPSGAAVLEATDAWVDLRTRGARVVARARLPLARVFVGPNGLEVFAARDGDAFQVVVRAVTKVSDDAGVTEQILPPLRALAASLPDGADAQSQGCGHLRMVLHPTTDLGETAVVRSAAVLPTIDDADAPEPAEGESPDEVTQRLLSVLRQRPYQLTVSATQTTADAAPVLSVSVGWAGREQRGPLGGDGA